MSAITFDTLKLAQRLRDQAKFTPEQAEQTAVALAESFRDWQDQMQLATKTDLAETKVELIKWVVGVGFALAGIILAMLRAHG